MSDADSCYRKSLQQIFGCSNLMCYFHVKQACREYLFAHFKGTKEQRQSAWLGVSDDIDMVRAAQHQADFRSRGQAVETKWASEHIPDLTAWVDKKGKPRNFLSYFAKQWLCDITEWHLGAARGVLAPGTNNGAESRIKYTRLDAGGVVGSVGETIAFALAQMLSLSLDGFDPSATRHIEARLWSRAAAFRSLFGTPAIQSVPHMGHTYYVCHPREDSSSADVRSRLPITKDVAKSRVKALAGQLGGQPTTWENLAKHSGGSGDRIIRVIDGKAVCSCPAFCGARMCFHTLGLSLHLGLENLPPVNDDTLLSTAARGGKRKAPNRYAVPLQDDAKDKRIKALQAELARRKDATAQRHPQRPELASKAAVLKRPAACTNPKAGPHPRDSVLVRVMSHLGKEHLFDLPMDSGAVAGDCIVAIADRLGADLDKVHVMDVTDRIPFMRTADDDEPLKTDRVVHVRAGLRGG